MYCSLKEAYRVPDFDSAGKKKRSCAGQGAAAPDANDSYFPESGHGETARYNSSYVEKFENKLPETRDKIAYRAQAPDYDYYCKAYGVCPSTKVEGFENPKCSAPAAQRYEVPISPQAKAAYDEAMKTSFGESKPSSTPNYAVARREVDMSKVDGYYDEDLEQYLQTSVMKAAPVQAPIANLQPRPEWLAQPDDYTDTPFTRAQQYFEKVPAAVHTHSASVTPPPSQLTQSFVETPRAPAPKYPTASASAAMNPWQNFWDLAIFILAGLLVIVLCEQLFKVAMMVGMRRTIDILEPFLNGSKIM